MRVFFIHRQTDLQLTATKSAVISGYQLPLQLISPLLIAELNPGVMGQSSYLHSVTKRSEVKQLISEDNNKDYVTKT